MVPRAPFRAQTETPESGRALAGAAKLDDEIQKLAEESKRKSKEGGRPQPPQARQQNKQDRQLGQQKPPGSGTASFAGQIPKAQPVAKTKQESQGRQS